MNLLTRRTLLAGLSATAATLVLDHSALAFLDARPDDFLSSRSASPKQLTAFPMTQVRLLPGLFQQQAEINQTWLASLSTDRLLHSFRITSGLSSNATPYGGWERPDADLRGHFNGGHYLSAVALAYASSGNDTLRKNGDTMVAELARCQKAKASGYLSAYPEAQFEALARGSNTWSGGKVWAPFYTLHKILAGLLDMYVHTGNEQALSTAEGIAGWVNAYFEGIGDDQRQRLLRVEYGGMNEVLANLYGLTGRQRYLDTARLFEQPAFLDPLAMHRDDLRGLHANTHVPKIIGAARMFEITGEPRYRDIALYFLDEVLTERSYAIGNTSANEFWRSDPGNLKGSLAYSNAECCVAYNLMKLDRHAFSWTGDGRWMDAYERTLWNARVGTQNPQGLKQYFFPLAAGFWRHFNSSDDSFWCCTGSGAEEFAKFNDTIYFHDAAGASANALNPSSGSARSSGATAAASNASGGPSATSADLWVNQFIASELDWKEAGFLLRQETSFPAEQGTTLRIKLAAPQRRTFHIRIPSWADGGSVKINGRDLEAFAQPGSYLSLTRQWHDGDKIEVSLPMRLTSEPLAGDPTLRAALYGPLVLAANLGQGPASGPLKIGGYESAPKQLQPVTSAAFALPAPDARSRSNPEPWVEVVSAKDLTFKTAAAVPPVPVRPLYQITDEKYAVYWNTSSKT